MKTEKLGTEPAFGYSAHTDLDDKPGYGRRHNTHTEQTGMSKRFYAACAAKYDFDEFSDKLQESIAGKKPNIVENPKDYMIWIAKGRAIWMYMQADELLNQENQ